VFSKNGKSTFVSNYRPIFLLNNFSKISEFVIHDHVFHYLKFKISPYQHGFSKTKSTSTNLYVDFISPLVGSQRQVDAIYFDLSNAFGLVPHFLLLHKLSAFGRSGVLSSPSEVLSGVPHTYFQTDLFATASRKGGPLLFQIRNCEN
jgi:hypothetical protein